MIPDNSCCFVKIHICFNLLFFAFTCDQFCWSLAQRCLPGPGVSGAARRPISAPFFGIRPLKVATVCTGDPIINTVISQDHQIPIPGKNQFGLHKSRCFRHNMQENATKVKHHCESTKNLFFKCNENRAYNCWADEDQLQCILVRGQL